MRRDPQDTLDEARSHPAANRAVREAELAYTFGPGSYTWSAWSAASHLRQMLNEPTWIELYDEYSHLNFEVAEPESIAA
jgi:hypothetical protein